MIPALTDLLDLGSRELISFVGAGGKSTLLLGLARELADRGNSVVVTTTTKMGADEVPDWAQTCRSAEDVAATLAAGGVAFLVDQIDGSKVTGPAAGLVDEVFTGLDVDCVLVEADGASGRAIKAPASHEPVIPSQVTTVVIVAGLDAISGRLGDVAHRPEFVAAITGLGLEETLGPDEIAAVLSHPEGGLARIPDTARVVVALTKVQPGPRAAAAAAITAILDAHPRIDRVYLLPFGDPANPW